LHTALQEFETTSLTASKLLGVELFPQLVTLHVKLVRLPGGIWLDASMVLVWPAFLRRQ
jgi:hypothetical protein